MKKIIEIKNLNFAYEPDKRFDDFCLELYEGDIVSLIGPSGSGKTTLLKILCHKLPNESVYYDSVNVKTYSLDVLRENIVVVFDHPFNTKFIKDEISFYLKKLNRESGEITSKVNKYIEKFNLQEKTLTELNKLDYNTQTLIKILRYLIIEPKFIAIDCLFSGLNKKDKKILTDVIIERDMTLLNVIYDLEDALYGNKICVLDDFTTILEGNTLSILKTDTLLKRLGFKLPLAINLSIELNHYEVIKKIYTDKERLIKELWK